MDVAQAELGDDDAGAEEGGRRHGQENRVHRRLIGDGGSGSQELAVSMQADLPRTACEAPPDRPLPAAPRRLANPRAGPFSNPWRFFRR